MKKIKILLLVMAVLTAIYLIAVVYANATSLTDGDTVYTAVLYEGEPSKWYLPKDLGITRIIEYGTWLHVVVPNELNPGGLALNKPIFKYKEKFYRISEVHVTPGLPEHVRWEIPIGGVLGGGWAFTGVLYCSKRRKPE